MGPSCPLGIARFDPAQEKRYMARTCKVRNWTMSVMKLQKAGEESQSNANTNDPRRFIVPETQVAFFFSIFMDLDLVSVHKNAKRNLATIQLS